MEAAKGTPLVCEGRIDEVGALKTLAAREALLRFAASSGGSYHEALAEALSGFGEAVIGDVRAAYDSDAFAQYANGRLVLAQTAARLSATNDDAIRALVDMCFDDYHEVVWVAKAALREQKDRAKALVMGMLEKPHSEARRSSLSKLLEELELTK